MKNVILFQISLRFVHNGPFDNKPTLVQIMVWYRTGYKSLYEANDGLVYRRIYARLSLKHLMDRVCYQNKISMEG